MRPRSIILAAITAVGLAGLLLWRWNALIDARVRADAAAQRLIATASDTRTILTLRQRTERVSYGERPTQDVLARVNEALAQAGLSASHFQTLRPESDVALSGPAANSGVPYRQQSLSLSLASMSVAELGAFLEAWEANASVWTITRIVLSRKQGRTAVRTTDSRFEVTLILSAVYIGDTL